MDMENIYGKTKGTALEGIIQQIMQAEANGTIIYICPVCGYEYVGDITQEPDDYVCPLCGVPKAKFTKKA